MTTVDGLARTIGRWAAASRIAVRTTLPVDTNPVPAEWEHVTKVDPEDEKRLPVVYPLYLRHTDGISVGGSRDVTPENTEDTFELLEYVPTPAFHEPSDPEHVTDGTRDRAAFLAIPEVLNGDTESLIGKLGAGIEHVRDGLAPSLIERKAGWLPEEAKETLAEFAASWLLSEAVFEAYIIQNVESAAAREADVTEEDLLDESEAAQRAAAAERRLGSELVYLEYSGTFGGREAERLLSAIDGATNWSRVWYGGGIDSRDATRRALRAGADTVVVGDAFHEVASEEATLAERARDDLGGGTDRERVATWFDDRIDPAETTAARYLSTIPSVSNPVERARRYLVAGITTWLEYEDLADDVAGAHTAAALKESIRAAGIPRVEELSELGEHGRMYAGNCALAAVSARNGIEAGSLPVEHLSLGVPTGIDVE